MGSTGAFNNRASIFYALFYAGQFVLLGVQLPFFAGWLNTRGFIASEIGLITGAALIARLAFGPLVAFWADHQDDERHSLRLVSCLFALGAILLTVAPGKWVIGAAAVVVIWTFGLLVPLTDSAVLRADRNGHLHYGQTRAVGSAAFLTTTIIGGALLTGFGIGASVWVMAMAASFAFFAALALPAGVGGRSGAKPMSWREARKLVMHPIFIAVLFCAGLTQGAHAVYYAFSYLRWEALGYSAQIIGLLWATGVIVEIIVLTKARGLVLRFGPAMLLLLGAGGAAIRWLITALEPPLWVLFLTQTLHALTFAATYLGTIEFLDRAVPTRLVNTAMTLMSTTGVGAITGLATVIAGFVWQGQGPVAAYMMMAAMGLGAFTIALIISKIWNGKKMFE